MYMIYNAVSKIISLLFQEPMSKQLEILMERRRQEEVRKARFNWALLRNSIRDTVQAVQDADIKTVLISHGIHHQRKINHEKELKQVIFIKELDVSTEVQIRSGIQLFFPLFLFYHYSKCYVVGTQKNHLTDERQIGILEHAKRPLSRAEVNRFCIPFSLYCTFILFPINSNVSKVKYMYMYIYLRLPRLMFLVNFCTHIAWYLHFKYTNIKLLQLF